MEKPTYPYIHRDINWCDFNARVLEEAADPSLALIDRLKFLAIFSSNLDEFFRIKVASLHKLEHLKKSKAAKWLGYSPGEVLEAIKQKVTSQQEAFGKIWREMLLPSLRDENIIIYQTDHIDKRHVHEVMKFFRVHVQGHLHLVISGETLQSSMQLANRGIYLVVPLRHNLTGKTDLGFVNIPSTQVPRFIALQPLDGKQYLITLDDIIRCNMDLLFSGYQKDGLAYSIKLNRDEDYEIEDEFSGDLVKKLQDKIARRMEGEPVRFLYDLNMPETMLQQVMSYCVIENLEVVRGGRYHNLHELFQLMEPLGRWLKSPSYPPVSHRQLEASNSVLEAMEDRDYLLHFPYHEYASVLRFFNEAAVDPSVTEIKVALYRISKKSQIAHALISAAHNGKRVTVFVEVKARYDELNNIQWAQQMEKAGIQIIYSLPGLKVHAKVALVVRKDKSGLEKKYAYLSTGNFNEKTAELYADHGLLTTHAGMADELSSLFRFLQDPSLQLKFDHLLVAGFNMKEEIINYINGEIATARKGLPSAITLKVNGMDERDIIEKLYEASQAGVKVNLIVRAGCSLVPGINGVSENINAYRLVDMFLEHARVYWFYAAGQERIFLSSADMMNRNLNRRIEVGFPVYDEGLKNEIMHIINIQLADNTKLRPIVRLEGDLLNDRKQSTLRAQEATYRWIKRKEELHAYSEKELYEKSKN